MLNNGMEIGSHSSSHSSLSGLSIADAREEIERSKEKIEINLKSPCDHFAFPFGSRADYNQSLLDYVKEAGFKSCSLNIHGYNHLRKNVFCFKRIIMEETTNIACLLG
jgi:peptidoglycan/xylan/chitin deacetylase (PgdA/CDA1 family)